MSNPMSTSMKSFHIIVLLVAMVTVSAMADTASGSFEKSIKVSGKADISVETGSGNIVVKAGETSDVHIYAKIRARDGNGMWSGGGLSANEKVKRLEANPPIRQEGNRIIIGKIEDKDLRNNVSISYEINVPAETQLNSHSGSGDQKVTGIDGPVEVETGSGSITANKIRGTGKFATGSGEVDLEDIKGAVTISSGSGNIKALGVGGAFNGHTGSGSITMDQTAIGDVIARAGSGSIHLRHVRGAVDAHTGSGHIDAEGEASNTWKLHTGSGSVDVHIPTNANFDLDARSGSGSVSTSHPLLISGTVKHNHLRGKVGNGGAILDIETGSGSIQIN
jgi:DUF4097 and DUF4098 domain-containing protein YvlB